MTGYARISALLVPAVLASGCSRLAPAVDEGGSSEETTANSGETTTADSGETGDDETGSMLPIVDLPADNWCDPLYGEPCPDGQKCVPYSFECCNLFECVPVLGDGQHGDPCVSDWPESNLDECGATSWCYEDVCREFCGPNGDCPGNATCLSSTSIAPFVCVDQCDPVAQDCPPGQGCYLTHTGWGFQCAELSDGAGLGEPCSIEMFQQECEAGLVCVGEDYYPGGCGGHAHAESGCCTPLCYMSSGEAACPLAPAGASCGGAVYDALYDGVGACMGPTFAAGELQIVEVAADPPGIPIYEAPLEYIELINLSDRELELGFLSISDDDGEFDKTWLSSEFQVMSGDGGCIGGSPTCLAPGRRVLLVIDAYAGETGDALVLSTARGAVVGGFFQPFTRAFVTDDYDQIISSYRAWDDPGGEPLPVDEQPLHRIDLAGPDVPQNWVSGPASPGL